MCNKLSKKWHKIFLVYLPKLLFMGNVYESKLVTKMEKKQKQLLKKSLNSVKSLERLYHRSDSLTKRVALHEPRLIYENEKLNESFAIDRTSPLFGIKRKIIYAKNEKHRALQKLIVENIGYLNNITYRLLRDFESKKVRIEWEALADVLDRLFLVLFALALAIGCAFIIFAQTPFLNYTAYTEEKMKICEL
jgi:hypothetical protein